tara:strand:- start:40 stop:198 length:159 start_codon:yes stop_codon:yes gene_type:complete
MNEEQMFKKLEELRLSGEINMFGAPTYMTNNWGIPEPVAKEVFRKWTETFNG